MTFNCVLRSPLGLELSISYVDLDSGTVSGGRFTQFFQSRLQLQL